MSFWSPYPCGGEYILGAPQVACAKLKVESGEFKVVARNLSRENKYVKAVTLNGKPITDWKIRHADIMAGGGSGGDRPRETLIFSGHLRSQPHRNAKCGSGK
jgi:putative alpha-1,2-mannosidase